jgi:ribosome-binding protein aMBF1 (putative translation factor)
MIRTDHELRRATALLKQATMQMTRRKGELRRRGHDAKALQRLLAVELNAAAALRHEIAQYRRIKRGNLSEFRNLDGLGQLLIAARLARGLSQRDLAKRMQCTEAQVSRDERTEYWGITVARANRLLEALGARLTAKVTLNRTRSA